MRIWRSKAEIPPEWGTSVVTIGIFDGVHLGHRKLVSQTVEMARAGGHRAVALTFDPHPQTVHHPDQPVELICSLEDRLSQLGTLQLDAILVQHYDLDFAAATPREFVSEYLVGTLDAKGVVVGQDVRFGRDNAGNLETLMELGKEFGFTVVSLPDLVDAATGRRYSSTWVRELLQSGDVAGAARILGAPHRLRGVVEHGHKRGRTLGFPTANLGAIRSGEIPADGVYAGWLIREVASGDNPAIEKLPAAISVGSNPQFAGVERTIEAHVLGRADLNLYGQNIALDFVHHLRPMATFASLDELLAQMDLDLERAAQVLGVPCPHRIDPALVTAH